ncbi:hypothetical protein RYX36_019711 [Vicia faba]
MVEATSQFTAALQWRSGNKVLARSRSGFSVSFVQFSSGASMWFLIMVKLVCFGGKGRFMLKVRRWYGDGGVKGGNGWFRLWLRVEGN